MVAPSEPEAPSSNRLLGSADLVSLIRDLLRRAAPRFADLSEVGGALRRAEEVRGVPPPLRGRTWETAYGYPGIALLLSNLDRLFPGEGWADAAESFLRAAAEDALSRPESAGTSLLGGMSGLAWVVSRCSPARNRWSSELDAILIPLVRRASARLENSSGFACGQIDLVNGATGAGLFLLERREKRGASEALLDLLRILVALTTPGEKVPRWHTPAALQLAEGLEEAYPAGSLNPGLAHGVSGILGFLARCRLHGIQVPGLGDSLRGLAGWLSVHAARRPGAVAWPHLVALPEEGSAPSPATSEPEKALVAWCNGASGIAAALWTAGCALNDRPAQALSLEAVRGVSLRVSDEASVEAPMFCHGTAGVLQVLHRFWRHTGIDDFREAGEHLARRLVGVWDAGARFGYRSSGLEGEPSDDPGLLEGAAGVLLVLSAAALGEDPSWDRLFLLS